MSQRTRGYPSNKHMLRKFYNSQIRNSTLFWGFLLSMSIKTQKQWGHCEVPKNLTWNLFKGDPRMILLLAGSGLHWVPCSILDMLGQGLITLSKNCPSVGGVWTPAGRTSVQLANFRGSSMFYPTKSGHPKNGKKKGWIEANSGASLKRQEQLCQVRSRPGSGFIPFFVGKIP